MKSVLLVRHAKSSWDNILQKDIDRPLNERGIKDAPAMAGRMVEKKIPIDAFISSPAKRAFTTATYFAKAYNQKEEQIIVYPELFEERPKDFLKVINKTDDKFNCIAIFSHNPGITEFANQLTNTRLDEMPTCAIFAIQVDILCWKEFEYASKKFWFFDYPKLK